MFEGVGLGQRVILLFRDQQSCALLCVHGTVLWFKVLGRVPGMLPLLIESVGLDEGDIQY